PHRGRRYVAAFSRRVDRRAHLRRPGCASDGRRGHVTLPGRSHDHRVLFLPATSRDAATTAALLSPAGIEVTICHTIPDVLSALAVGAGAILVIEEAMSPANTAALHA